MSSFLFCAGPLLLLFVLTIVLMRVFVAPFIGPLKFGWGRLAAYAAVSFGIIYATYRMRSVVEGVGRTEEQYRLMIQSASEGIVILDRSGKYIDANDKAVEILGYSRVELLRMNSPNTVQFEGLRRRKDGTDVYVEASATTLRNGNLMGIIRDVTERKRTQEELHRSQQKYKSLFDNSLAAVYRFTAQGKFLDCNQAFAKIFLRASPAEVMDRPTSDFCFEPKLHELFLRHLRRRGTLTGSELLLRRKDGTPVWALANVTLSEEEGVEIVHGTLIDITDRKRAEDRITASLREKEVLLKEVHHRVKNNLQIISSLLALQADSIEDPRALAAFQVSQERINSIALLHETLYRSDDLARIDMAQYIQRLATDLANTYRPVSGSGINLNLCVPHVLVDLNVAMPCGLIVTELLTNSFKYAFPEGGEGEIYVELVEHRDGDLVLTIGDTGVGLPLGLVPGKSESLGLELVNTLVKQLKGKLTMPAALGAEFQIHFTPLTKKGAL